MSRVRSRAFNLTAAVSVCIALDAGAQANGSGNREVYFSWGYNAAGYRNADMHFRQPSRGDDFILHQVRGEDRRAWSTIFGKRPTVPQYSVRIGYFVTRKRDVAVELNFEHARFEVTYGQRVRITGMVGGERMDSLVVLTDRVLAYEMNNGANFLLFNLVKRVVVRGTPGYTGNVAVLGKAGVGLLLPHANNVVFGRRNEQGFQFGGFDAGVEAALRVHFYGRAYVEFMAKGVYAPYRGIRTRDGTAALDVWARMTAVSIGWSVNRGQRPQPD